MSWVDRFGNDSFAEGFGDEVEFGFMTDADLDAISALDEFETTQTTRQTRPAAKLDAWWEVSDARSRMIADASARISVSDDRLAELAAIAGVDASDAGEDKLAATHKMIEAAIERICQTAMPKVAYERICEVAGIDAFNYASKFTQNFEKNTEATDFAPLEEITSKVRHRDKKPLWWRSKAQRRALMDAVKEKLVGQHADMQCVMSVLDRCGVVYEEYGSKLRGPCPDDDHFSNEKKKPFNVSNQGYCYCHACAQSKGVDYKGKSVITLFREKHPNLTVAESYKELAELSGIDVMDFTPDKMVDAMEKETRRFVDASGKYTWHDIHERNRIAKLSAQEKRAYMEARSIIDIRRAAQTFYMHCLSDPRSTLLSPIEDRLTQARTAAQELFARRDELQASIPSAKARLEQAKAELREAQASALASFSAGEIGQDELEHALATANAPLQSRIDFLEVSLESAQAELASISSAVSYHERVIAQAKSAHAAAAAAVDRAKDMGDFLVAEGIAKHGIMPGTYVVPNGIGYAPALPNAAVRYLSQTFLKPDGTHYSIADIRAAGIGQMQNKFQREHKITEDALYDRLTFPVYSTETGDVIGFSGIRPDADANKDIFKVSRTTELASGEEKANPAIDFDWKTHIYNANGCMAAVAREGVCYRANNPLDAERLRAAGYENVLAPLRGGDVREDGSVQFHFKSHADAIAALVERIDTDTPIKIVNVTPDMARDMTRGHALDGQSPVTAGIQQALQACQDRSFGMSEQRSVHVKAVM